MRNLRHHIMLTVLVVAGIALALDAGAAGTKLIYAPKKGDTCKYKYTSQTKPSGAAPKTGVNGKSMDMSISASGVFRDTVTAVSAKGATSSYKFESASVTMMGQKNDLKATLNKAGITVTFGPNGVPISMTGIDKLDMSAGPMLGALASAFRLPAKSVSVGATWKAASGPGAGAKTDAVMRFVGLQTRGGRKVAKIAITIDSKVDMAAPGGSGSSGKNQSKTVQVTSKGSGTAYVDIVSGRLVELTSTVKTSMPSGGGAPAMSMTTTATLKRIGN